VNDDVPKAMEPLLRPKPWRRAPFRVSWLQIVNAMSSERLSGGAKLRPSQSIHSRALCHAGDRNANTDRQPEGSRTMALPGGPPVRRLFQSGAFMYNKLLAHNLSKLL
jgi:hypothetical protein